MNRPALAIAAITLLCALASPAHRPLSAGAAEVIDAGTFTLYLNGARIGEERFVIRQERSGTSGPIFRAVAEQNLKLDGQATRISMALEATGLRARLRRYEAEINGGAATTIVGTVVSDRFRLGIRSPQGEEMREFLVRGRTAILDRYIAHQYFFVHKLLGSEVAIDAYVIVPRERRREPYRVENHGPDSISVAGGETTARHITLTAETGATRHLWLDGDRVIRVEVPDEGFVAVRSDAYDQTTN